MAVSNRETNIHPNSVTMLEKLQPSTVEKHPESDPRVVYIGSESATALVEAISSETSRKIVAALHDDPQPPSQIATAVDTSLANVNYHLEKLQEAGLITDVDTWYSEKGNEMTVYAPTDDPLVFAGTEDQTGKLQSLLQRVAAAVAILAAASVFVQWLVIEVLAPSRQTSTIRKATSAGATEGLSLVPIPPGLLFFTGGTFVLTIGVLVWSLST